MPSGGGACRRISSSSRRVSREGGTGSPPRAARTPTARPRSRRPRPAPACARAPRPPRPGHRPRTCRSRHRPPPEYCGTRARLVVGCPATFASSPPPSPSPRPATCCSWWCSRCACTTSPGPASRSPPCSAALMLPVVLLAPFAGRLVDRVETRRVLLCVSLAQAVVAGGLVLAGGLVPLLVLTALLGAGAAIAGRPKPRSSPPRSTRTGWRRPTAGSRPPATPASPPARCWPAC